MSINMQLMEEFLQTHESHYVGKYKHRASYINGDCSSKCHYYMLDESFRRIDIFVEIHYRDKITYTFSEALHEQEQIYIVKDIIKHLMKKLSYESMLHYSLYEGFVKNTVTSEFQLNPIDYVNILDYIKYHEGINQDTIDQFYKLYIPCLENLISAHNYKQFMDSVVLVLKNILYEYEWDGINSKYLDTEYQYHLYFIRKIIRIVYKHLDKFYTETLEELREAIEILCRNERFSLMIMTDFGNLVLSHFKVTKSLLDYLLDYFVLNDKDEERENVNLVFSYIYYIYTNDYEQYKAVILKILRVVINNMLTFDNSDLDLALGNSIVKSEGYEILLDLFHADFNTFIFTCFPINSFPKNLISEVKKELEGAVQYYAARMDNDKYRLSSFEQVSNINRLLMDSFGGWYK